MGVSNWILTLSSSSLEISVEYLWWSYCCVLLPGYFFTHILTHTKFRMLFLILWQIFPNSFVLHDRQKLFRQALCDILPVRKRLEWQCCSPFQQQFLCRYCIVRGAGSVQFRTAL